MRSTKEARANREAFVRANKKAISKILADYGRTYGNHAKTFAAVARTALGYAPKSCGRDIWIWIVNTYKLLYAPKKLPGKRAARSRDEDPNRTTPTPPVVADRRREDGDVRRDDRPLH